ncbi:helix-turn-helix transcriptional regulator [Phytomonospora endophytica]|uniref:Putative DNA-binding transcriptional regulator YafY n=1 Tax=Phytomonospora endophytica TaxID=714109 RepID=A0A841FI21_9ACTN|nr:YafY family protein [Phytomonospora endophytica]MBB6035395.1 putative DNA-binding transcriptional regulator YafY [Phytomonospora endophytica]GIG63853.1 transcriptional regulator [Phytomonospora endophytica]
MNRTDRLYALVEELRAVSPRPRSARRLAERFGVSVRTVERDLRALQESGVPIYAEAGRNGGYVIDKRRTLPPLSITPAEAVALTAALHSLHGSPFADAARSVLHKVRAVMPPRELAEADTLAENVVVIPARKGTRSVAKAVEDAIARRKVLELSYVDRLGAVSSRIVEPLGLLGGGEHWYLLAWCRTRDAVRGFRLERVRDATVLGEGVPSRDIDLTEIDALGRELVGLARLDVSPNTDRTVSR